MKLWCSLTMQMGMILQNICPDADLGAPDDHPNCEKLVITDWSQWNKLSHFPDSQNIISLIWLVLSSHITLLLNSVLMIWDSVQCHLKGRYKKEKCVENHVQYKCTLHKKLDDYIKSLKYAFNLTSWKA